MLLFIGIVAVIIIVAIIVIAVVKARQVVNQLSSAARMAFFLPVSSVKSQEKER